MKIAIEIDTDRPMSSTLEVMAAIDVLRACAPPHDNGTTVARRLHDVFSMMKQVCWDFKPEPRAAAAPAGLDQALNSGDGVYRP